MNQGNAGADWRQGYVTTLDYTAGLYASLFPEHLNFACALNGVEPPVRGRQFDYFELGCGRGTTVSVLAACNPQARFYANDFMPSHVAGGRQLAREAGLDNLTLLEHSFGELADGQADLPAFDYITMQGVYTWVSAEVRQQIVRFIARHLKPGGVVSVGYNAMPGWAASASAQRLLQASAQWSGGDGVQRVEHARGFLQQMARAGAEAFQDNPAMDRRLAQVAGASPAYLQHEYLNRHWQPLYHADVAEDLATAKLDFVGSAMLPHFGMAFPPEQQALLDAIPDPRWRETAKDYLLGNSFRNDVFVRGRRGLSPARRRQRLGTFQMALTVPVDTALKQLARADADMAAAMRPVLDQLAARPISLASFEDDGTQHTDNATDTPDSAQLMAAVLSMNRHASLFESPDAPDDGRRARAWNAAIAADALLGGTCTALASPVTGGGIDTDIAGLAVYRQLADRPDADPDSVVERALQALRRLAGSGAEASGAQAARVRAVVEHEVPVWRRLGVL
ncbi:class I SAM-dependent methyltransferase [Rubrivivax sp. RP6-9]|uniref:class I SAM-dependent methyltransferase n=1 Tax=Rubrivivax sp. RP6-9 TaxID=3415750 RepID=UPI003CC59D85